MIFYWVVFTLSDKPNKYLDMFCLSYASMLKNNAIKSDDIAIILCDSITAEKAKDIKFLNNVKKVIVPKPNDALEGMLLRYRLQEYYPLKENDECVSLDVDMICVRPFELHFQENKLLAYPEGEPTNSNYCGDMILTTPVGCSPTIFVYKYCDTIASLLRSVKGEKQYYTVDCPYFNKALEAFKDNVAYLPNSILSFNGNTNQGTAAFINLCGIPGNEFVHWYKVLDIFLQFD